VSDGGEKQGNVRQRTTTYDNVRQARKHSVPNPVFGHQSIRLEAREAPSRHDRDDDSAHRAQSKQNREGREPVPRHHDDRRHKQDAADVDDRWRGECGGSLGGRRSDSVGRKGDGDEQQSSQRAAGRSDDDVERFRASGRQCFGRHERLIYMMRSITTARAAFEGSPVSGGRFREQADRRPAQSGPIR